VNDENAAVIHIVDDDDSLRTALSRVLRCAGYAVRGYGSAGEFLVAEPDSRPGCLLLDLEMPGPDGLALQEALHRQQCRLPIVFMSAHRDIPRTVRAIKAGASEFLVKPIATDTLLATLESALATGGAHAASRPRAPPGTPFAMAHTTIALGEREQVVLRGIMGGLLNKQIATELALSERTVKSCRANLMRKLGAQSLADLVQRAAALIGH
jgi:FixJ family two-component response regulator